MNVKVRVTFDMDLAESGQCKTTVSFALSDYPGVPVPEETIPKLMREVGMLCNAMTAAEHQLFKGQSKS